jgi:hypothetical protein
MGRRPAATPNGSLSNPARRAPGNTRAPIFRFKPRANAGLFYAASFYAAALRAGIPTTPLTLSRQTKLR